MTSLGSELVRFEKATRLLQALIKGKEETDGQGPSLFATLAASIQQQQQGDTTTPNAAHAAHDAGVLRLREQQRVSAAALQEIQTNFEELRTNNKEDIQNLLHSQCSICVHENQRPIEEAKHDDRRRHKQATLRLMSLCLFASLPLLCCVSPCAQSGALWKPARLRWSIRARPLAPRTRWLHGRAHARSGPPWRRRCWPQRT
jgi:hypothetical protein